MVAKPKPILLAGQWKTTPNTLKVINPYTGKAFDEVCLASQADVAKAISESTKGFEITRKLSSHQRSEVLDNIVQLLKANRDELGKTISLETGKALRDSLAETDRCINTFTVARDEAKGIEGEFLPVDITHITQTKRAIVGHFPIGPVSGITPFNFPLNLVAHKIAPALACGNPIIIKPASKTPLSALKLGEFVVKAGWPKGAISILPCRSQDAQALITDDRIKVFSFTGSNIIGWKLKAKAGKKRVLLELGGNGAVVVWDDADLEKAAQKCAWGGMYYAGQNCIHVQRIFVEAKTFDKFSKMLIPKLKKYRFGDPVKPTTDLSTMVDEENAVRITKWINDAIKRGAKVLYKGPVPKGAPKTYVPPHVLTNVPKTAEVSCKEAFGPVILIEKVKTFEQALKGVNASIFGLQAGVFTKDVGRIFQAFSELDVGGVMINEASTFRVDNMPYGGIKESGLGREGIKYAIEEMTERKVMILELGK